MYNLVSKFVPAGDQPQAIKKLTEGVLSNKKKQVLLGVTGSGKTFTMANVIKNLSRPVLVIAPNKTLAAQLYNEFTHLFPDDAVEYFVSYYDYYQPEAYIAASDTYIQKDSSINEMIDKMRHSSTRSVLTQKQIIIVASVSCIYGLGAPEEYLEMRVKIHTGQEKDREVFLKNLVEIQYDRNDIDFHRGSFRVRGDRVEIYPAYEEALGIRVEFFGDEIELITEFDPLTGASKKKLKKTAIFPATHYALKKETLKTAAICIQEELKERIEYFRIRKKFIEAQRIEERTNFDLEMIQEIGYCNGIENYSRHLNQRPAGHPPPTLMDYFSKDFLVFIDESHITVPQLNGMYNGDRSRKLNLVDHGFRLPSAVDNRPLKFEEFNTKTNQVIYVSATPADYEIKSSDSEIVEQVVRPTGLTDPEVKVEKAENQVDHLLSEIQKRIEKNQRVLVTTLTKKMAEDLTDYYNDLGISVQYLHSEVKTLERIKIINDLRKGEYDVLIGINLLREGLDIPEVALVAILDADKEGFLRSERALIQTFGRAARNTAGLVILYADKMTKSMDRAIKETERRRNYQLNYNKKNNIIPSTIKKEISNPFGFPSEDNNTAEDEFKMELLNYETIEQINTQVKLLEKKMERAADNLEFEQAALIRDRINMLKKAELID